MTPNEQKAKDVLKAVCNSQYDSSKHDWMCPRDHSAEAAALAAAGLLVTPDHEAALAACEAYAKQYEGVSGYVSPVPQSVINVGRRSLDAKKPKNRYYVERFATDPAHPDEYRVRDRERRISDVRGFGTKVECEAIAAALAALDAKEAGR